MRVKQGIYVEDINKVYITGAGYINHAFTGVGVDTIGYSEVVWKANLTRSNSFQLSNIDDVEIGQVPQLHLTFPYMNIDDFIIIQKMLKERHLIINYFDVDLGQRVTHEMAVTKNERKKVYAYKKYITGITDFSINFVGTNRDEEMLKKCTIVYNSNGGTGSISSYEIGHGKTKDSTQENPTYTFSTQVTLSSGTGFKKEGYHLARWNTQANGSGDSYLPNQSITIYDDLTLYAIWE